MMTTTRQSLRLARLSSPLLFGTRTAFNISYTVQQLPKKTFSTSKRTAAADGSREDDEVVLKAQQIPAPGAGNVRILLLNQHQAKNTISQQLLDDLSKHVESIAAEQGNGPTRALVLASNVDFTFCMGADMRDKATISEEG